METKQVGDPSPVEKSKMAADFLALVEEDLKKFPPPDCVFEIGPFQIICDLENFSVCRSGNKITLEW